MATHTENVVINPRRMEYLLAYFAMSKDGLIDELNATRKRKKPYSKEEIFNANNKLKISTLRRIDKIFERGLYFYTTHTDLEIDEKESILFRKREFNANLTHADRLMVSAAEEQNLYTQSIVELSEFECQRKLDKYSLEDNPYDTGVEIRKALGIEHPLERRGHPVRRRLEYYIDHLDEEDDARVEIHPSQGRYRHPTRKHLEYYVDHLGDQGVLVIEYINRKRSREGKFTLEGMFVDGCITIRRLRNVNRELFTLIHELGHYLLDLEELDQNVLCSTENRVERWCNRFAFAVLMEEDGFKEIAKLHADGLEVDDELVAENYGVKDNRYLSLFNYLLDVGKIDRQRYDHLKKELDALMTDELVTGRFRQRYAREKRVPLCRVQFIPLLAGLERDIYREGYLLGSVEEYDILQRWPQTDLDKLCYA